MRYDDPELQDRLAAEYALGMLNALTRRRMEALMAGRPLLAARVAAWQDRLSPLADATHPTVPPAHVLTALHRRLFHDHPVAPALSSWWDRIAVWRWLAGTGLALAAALAVYVAVATLPLDRPAGAAVPRYVAVLNDPADAPGIVVTAFDAPWRLTVEPLDGLAVPPGSAVQIWAVERGTGVARPLARIEDRAPVTLAMSEEMWALVKTAESLLAGPPGEPGAAVLSGPCIELRGAS